ncbi:LysR substrate-binding domain-containing protein [Streptomyces sp. TS71-3]|uniref:LysR substrate-binding domain-containing protein n=1 Tax=Streptomyces sp. TS71-3 TaxID=2733862 RepID=UPI001B214DD5|nr:LysR substrate-binding domain-containing protein [Streptomyces sp. TS71-3]GHJ41565.1 LysR family transcriptional regulator [Streptomyces sp. TS71-3]
MDDTYGAEITFSDLEMFLVFSKTEHFGHTATELDVSVATVQRGIRALERKLGVRLVEQAGRRVRMLHTGHILVREAHTVLRARHDAVDTVRAESGLPHRRLRIAHTYSLGLGFVPGVLAELLQDHPELRFRCWQGPATDVVSALLHGEADVAFTSLSPTESDIVVEPLFTQALLLTVPADDPLAGSGTVRLSEVQGRSFIAMEPGSSSRTHMVNACARAGFIPRITVEGSDLFVVESMVGAGIGVSVVPEGMDNHLHPRVARLPIEDPGSAGRTIFLAYGRGDAAHESVRSLARIARTHGRRLG